MKAVDRFSLRVAIQQKVFGSISTISQYRLSSQQVGFADQGNAGQYQHSTQDEEHVQGIMQQKYTERNAEQRGEK